MKKQVFWEIIGVVYCGNKRLASVLAKEGKLFEKFVERKEFKHPESGNKVKFDSLPAEEQKKIRNRFKKRIKVKKPEDKKKKAEKEKEKEKEEEEKEDGDEQGDETEVDEKTKKINKEDYERKKEFLHSSKKKVIDRIDEQYDKLMENASDSEKVKMLQDKATNLAKVEEEFKKHFNALEREKENGVGGMEDEEELDTSIFNRPEDEESLLEYLKEFLDKSGFTN